LEKELSTKKKLRGGWEKKLHVGYWRQEKKKQPTLEKAPQRERSRIWERGRFAGGKKLKEEKLIGAKREGLGPILEAITTCRGKGI